MLIEETSVPDAVLPIDALKAHIRASSGFGQNDIQDDVLRSFFRAAMSAIEARIGKALIERVFEWTSSGWADPQRQQLPIAPITAISRITLVAHDGVQSDLDPATYWLKRDAQAPSVRPKNGTLPCPESGGEVLVQFSAGYAATWEDIPRDLQQAVMMLAAHYYEYRQDTGLAGGCMPFGVTSLIERFRMLRLGARGLLS